MVNNAINEVPNSLQSKVLTPVLVLPLPFERATWKIGNWGEFMIVPSMQNSIKLLINSIEWPVSYKLSPYNPKS
jgi:hypothetical protein